MPAFTEDFNVTAWDDSPAHLAEEGAIVSTFIFGNLVGALTSSILADKCGRRNTMFIAAAVFLLGGGLQVGAMVSGSAVQGGGGAVGGGGGGAGLTLVLVLGTWNLELVLVQGVGQKRTCNCAVVQ